MMKLRAVAWRLAVLLLVLCVGACGSEQLSEADSLYNQAVANWPQYQAKPDIKAMACGRDEDSRTWCSWSWGADTVERALNSAMEACKAKAQKSCFTFATGGMMSGWAQQISDTHAAQQARDANDQRARADNRRSDSSSTMDILSGMLTGLSIVNSVMGGGGTSGYTPSSYSGGQSIGDGGRSATCQMMIRAINDCRQRQASMGSLGTVARGTSGQAGSFNDCANLYGSGYNAACR